ncbi:MAG TPA: hypothetical protein VLN45_12845, partial [Ignavibacteriaceae bacterium]|nr:hypothetical protein [Ignavibacteriaceae bacterium]
MFLRRIIFCSYLSFIFFIQTSFPQQSNLSKAVNYISSYIASEEFNEIKKKDGDLIAVDSIYKATFRLLDNDYSEALFALSAATLPYREVPIVIPLINSVWDYPLVSANDSVYYLKNKNLPTR